MSSDQRRGEPSSRWSDGSIFRGISKWLQKTKLTNDGKFVKDCPVIELLNFDNKFRVDGFRELTHMRYTACTSKPDNFKSDSFSLRQKEFNRRRIEILIAVTMYDEDKTQLSRTLCGIAKNINSLCSREDGTWIKNEGWKKVVVCIVSDGRKKISQSALEYLSALGVYQEGIAVESIIDRKVEAHIFEYTTRIPLENSDIIVPIQILFCLKEKNTKKINSHRWIFNAFSPILEPKICVLIDVGTKPGSNAIYNLWETFELHPKVAGACGEIVAMKGRGWYKLLNPIVSAQNFEYKISNILDKPLEHVLGYITVLPGAFSAYRYDALVNTDDYESPLASYFKDEAYDSKPIANGSFSFIKNTYRNIKSVFAANMYLAEDRILCFELFTKRDRDWLLYYNKSSQAETDVPEEISGFISQRRRWLNGSFFASIYAVFHFNNIWKSNHSRARKIFFIIQIIYQAFNLLFSWFALGNFYLTFHILCNTLANPQDLIPLPWDPSIGETIFIILRWVYFILVTGQFIFSMSNKPQSSKWVYYISLLCFAIIMGYTFFAGSWLTVNGFIYEIIPNIKNHGSIAIFYNDIFWDIVLPLLSTFVMYFVASIIMRDFLHMILCIIQYIFLIPFYVNVLNVYAFCNVNDVRETDEVHQLDKIVISDEGEIYQVPFSQPKNKNEQQDTGQANTNIHQRNKYNDRKMIEESRKVFRACFVLFWLFSNALLIFYVIAFVGTTLEQNFSQRSRTSIYIAVILWSVAGLSAFRFFGCITYIFKYILIPWYSSFSSS
ncbi:1759_t:CDS:2 [Dentiscutata erythropus]|uniref:Chitin synthase n=1 Tax=Dentiscutata erythropus TaxID=1348616 RepID=A0A9N9I4Z9_9GLOM|nr:1759_t:CDS:2 [Dentiscutata erythropus]